MKKLLVALSILALVGAGCADQKIEDKPAASGLTNTPSANAPMNDVPATTGGLQTLPAYTAPEKPIDDSTWVTTTTRAGVTIKAPVKGSYAPTWVFAILPATDPHLQGDCYVTTNTVYQRTTFPGLEHACLTSTAFSADAGTRMDYFLVKNGSQIQLVTFTKTHPANFNHNDYSATLDHVIGNLD